eukprot:m.126939 g.126939  ORF g.126939 m.126939 type:complete len:542 (-) comp29229_c0_seq1:217-1842(-)
MSILLPRSHWPVFVVLVLTTQTRGTDHDSGSGDDLNTTVAVAAPTGPSSPPTAQPSVSEPTVSPMHSLTTKPRRTITSTTAVASTMTLASTGNPSSSSPSGLPSGAPSNGPSIAPSTIPITTSAPVQSSQPTMESTTSPFPVKTQAISSNGGYVEFVSLPSHFAREIDLPIQIQLHSDRIVSLLTKVVPANKPLFREQNINVPTQLWMNKYKLLSSNQPMLINLTVRLKDFVCEYPCDVIITAGITLTEGTTWNDVVYQQAQQITMVKHRPTQQLTQQRTSAHSTAPVTLPTPKQSLMCLGVGANCLLSYQCCSHFCHVNESNAYNKSCTEAAPTSPTTLAVRTTLFVPTTVASVDTTTPMRSSTSTTEMMTCTDYPHWRDKQNHSCEIYLTLNWCSTNGNTASGWLGTAGQYTWVSNSTSGYPAAQACCSCGGGSWEVSNLDDSNVDVNAIEVDVTNPHFAWGIVIVLSLVGIAGFIWRSRVKAKSTPRYHSLLTDKLSVDNDSADYDLPTSVSLGDHYAMEETVVFQRTLNMNTDVTTY